MQHMTLSNNHGVTMDSREIAELTGKRHDHVLRDIRGMLEELYDEEGIPKFGGTYLNRQNSQTYPCFKLPRREVEILLLGYSVPLRAKVIDRLHELEGVAAKPVVPSTLPDALRLAADLAEQRNQLQLVVNQQAPKVAALERISVASGSMCISDAAKHLGVMRKALFQFMADNRWIFRRSGSAVWLAFEPRVKAGLLEHKVSVIGLDDGGDQRLASQVRVTPKGLAKLAQHFGGKN